LQVCISCSGITSEASTDPDSCNSLARARIKVLATTPSVVVSNEFTNKIKLSKVSLVLSSSASFRNFPAFSDSPSMVLLLLYGRFQSVRSARPQQFSSIFVFFCGVYRGKQHCSKLLPQENSLWPDQAFVARGCTPLFSKLASRASFASSALGSLPSPPTSQACRKWSPRCLHVN